MWEYKYGEFQESQVENAKETIRKQIYFLLLYVDPETREKFKNVDIVAAFNNIQTILSGMNELLFYPNELVKVCSLLESALFEYTSPDFKFERYRKLILDAGNEVLKIKEVK